MSVAWFLTGAGRSGPISKLELRLSREALSSKNRGSRQWRRKDEQELIKETEVGVKKHVPGGWIWWLKEPECFNGGDREGGRLAASLDWEATHKNHVYLWAQTQLCGTERKGRGQGGEVENLVYTITENQLNIVVPGAFHCKSSANTVSHLPSSFSHCLIIVSAYHQMKSHLSFPNFPDSQSLPPPFLSFLPSSPSVAVILILQYPLPFNINSAYLCLLPSWMVYDRNPQTRPQTGQIHPITYFCVAHKLRFFFFKYAFKWLKRTCRNFFFLLYVTSYCMFFCMS